MAYIRMNYPVGIQSFIDLRNNDCAYVDKTKYIYEIAHTSKFYFLSRPRRFGKSLLQSTLKAYFLGKRELFKGLAIEELEKEWTEYPVLYIDFNTQIYESEELLTERISVVLDEWEKKYNCAIKSSLAIRFENVIKNAYEKTGKQVVVLVDEYDKPLLQTMDNEKLNTAVRTILKSFYGNLKSQGEFIRFALITGVTKFSKASIFSDLNNLNDISISDQFAAICGITESELHTNFEPSIRQMAAEHDLSYKEMSAELKKLYDGYRFSRKQTEGIYNPFSLMNAFFNMDLGYYWFESGTPTFLVKQLRDEDYDLRQLQREELSELELKESDSLMKNPISVLFQAGYFTIKDYDKDFRTYRLGFPNREVEMGFMQCLLPYYTPKRTEGTFAYIKNFVNEVRAGQPEAFLQRMKTLLDGGDYRVAGNKEKYFQNVVFLLFRLMGFFCQVERTSSKGRADVVVQTQDYIYILELKLDGTVEEALQQIEEKGYALPFAADPRQLFKIGVNFSSETRCVEGWKVA